MLADLSALIAILAAILSGIQVLIMRTSARGDVLSATARYFWSPESRSRRDVVYQLTNKPFDTWTEDEISHATDAAIQISQVAFLMRHSYADRKAFLDYWAPWCVRMFEALAPLIAFRRREDRAPDQWIYFEWLARHAKLHLERTPWWNGRRFQRLKRATNELPDPDSLKLVRP